MKRLSLLTLALLIFLGCQSNTNIPSPSIISENSEIIQMDKKEESNLVIPQDSSQLLKVTTEDWHAQEGVLQRYEKIDNQWHKVGNPINIILGRNGLGWGIGLHTTPQNAPYIKKEGDGKAPAGLFALGEAFGYNNYAISFPYNVYQTTDHCVDDSHSKWYNQIIDSTQIQKDYSSFEHMKLNNNLYKYGLTIKHNEEQIPYAGSCIFIHIRSGNGKGTAGCTAMKEDEIMTVLKWLRQSKKPLLLQLPKEEMLTIAL